MKFLYLISCLLFIAGVVHGQNSTIASCPKLRITLPGSGYMSPGETYHIDIVTGETTPPEIRYEWRLPAQIKFEGQGQPVISFIAVEELDGLNVDVSVRVVGLPKNCPDSASKSFQILFNPGSPLEFDEYGKISANEEKARLSAVVEQLNKLKDANLLFVIGYKISDTKQAVRNRVQRVVNYLTVRHRITGDRLFFVFAEMESEATRIFAWRKNALIPENSGWERSIELLKIPRRKK